MGTFLYFLKVMNTQYLELLADRLSAFDTEHRVSVCDLVSSPSLGAACLVVLGLAIPEVSLVPKSLWLFSLPGSHTPSHVVQNNCESSAFSAMVL